MAQMSTDSHSQETYALIGAAMEVHGALGHGFLEPVYQEALSIEMTKRGIPYRREVALDVFYKGIKLDVAYRPDFICFEALVVETKALAQLGNPEYAQLLNYLKATGYRRGLLLNFGSPKLQYKRMVHGYGPEIGTPGSDLCPSVPSVDELP
jgi:GxxExxY protein